MNKFLIVYATHISGRMYTANRILPYDGEMLTADQVREFCSRMEKLTIECEFYYDAKSVRVDILNIIKLGKD